jgi:hypothetical protein
VFFSKDELRKEDLPMLKLSLKRKIQAIALILVSFVTVYASVTGPDARYTGAPGDIGTCVNCHDEYVNANVGPGSVAITGAPAVYQPGQQYTLTVTVTQSGRQKYGFQLTAIDADGNRAGTLTSLNSQTQIHFDTGIGGRQYIEHTEQGTNPTTGNSRIWQVRWTAPSTDIGTVRFFVAGNAANGNGTNQGDYIYTNSAISDSASTQVTVSLADPQLSGQTLSAGFVQRVNWNLTGLSNIDLIEVRYSTDDGATFPISNLAFTSQNSSTTGFDWTVPNITSSTVKLRVQVSTKVGTAVTAITGRFSIQSGSTPPPPTGQPTITKVEASGKHLWVYGNNFQDGAVVEMNGADIKTATVDAQSLKCKKAAKQIAVGQTVTVVVRNPDSSKSEEVFFTKTE